MLEVRDLAIAFDGVTVLDGVSFRVADGQTAALLGPSGSGKSTILRIIAGIVAADHGQVLIDGRDVSTVPTHRRRVGMVFQDEQLFAHLDVAGNIAFGLRLAGWRRTDIRLRIGELLELVGLDGFEKRSVRELSGGEAKRVAVARSLAPRPAVLLLDEPLTGLDRELQRRLATELDRLLDDTTAVWVTHDRAEADTVADMIVELDSD